MPPAGADCAGGAPAATRAAARKAARHPRDACRSPSLSALHGPRWTMASRLNSGYPGRFFAGNYSRRRFRPHGENFSPSPIPADRARPQRTRRRRTGPLRFDIAVNARFPGRRGHLRPARRKPGSRMGVREIPARAPNENEFPPGGSVFRTLATVVSGFRPCSENGFEIRSQLAHLSRRSRRAHQQTVPHRAGRVQRHRMRSAVDEQRRKFSSMPPTG